MPAESSVRRFWAVFFVAAALPSCSGAGDGDSRGTAALPAPGAPLTQVAAAHGAVASSVDERGVPQFLWAVDVAAAPTGATPSAAARHYLTELAPAHGVSAGDLSSLELVAEHRAETGAVVAELRQRVAGLPVYRSEVRVLMGADLGLVAISGTPRSAALRSAGAPVFARSAADALAAAASNLKGRPVNSAQVRDLGTGADEFQRLSLESSSGLESAGGARAQRVLFPAGDTLVPAWFVELYASTPGSTESAAWRFLVDAASGNILERRRLTESDAFDYRVWADPNDRRPFDGPQRDFLPHPTGLPDDSQPAFIPPNLVRVESLNHPPRNKVDPWLLRIAAYTTGNNVDAYADQRAPDGFSPGDVRAETSGNHAFDYTYDTGLDPLASGTQTKAAITNAFYIANFLHDYWYDSGFNEAAGNAQLDNYGRGGAGGDPMLVEVQDAYFDGQRNNANMSTPSDGLSPRMQIYVWNGEDDRRLTLTPGGNLPVGSATFGPTNFNLTAQVVLAQDGTGSPTDGCQPLVNNVAGRIVLVDRGACGFVVKAANVQAAGGAGMLLANNQPAVVIMGGADPSITIPSLSITQPAGAALKTALGQGAVSATMFRRVIDRDAALDGNIVSHEWGHYLHHRLADCGSQQCRAISEGWGDFVALHTSSHDGDNLDGAYPLAVYSTRVFGDSYFGIRRVPYTTDRNKNALTLKHIATGEPLPPVPTIDLGDNAEVHNAGEVWASMMWEAYVALQRNRGRKDTFESVRRRMADYVVLGLRMTPRDATFTEQRDALLAAVVACGGRCGKGDPGDQRCVDLASMAGAFASRGAGSCAVAPARESTDNAGIVESYDVKPLIVIGAVTISDSEKSCDRDGRLDAGERGKVTVTVLNRSPVELDKSVVTISSPTPGVRLANPSGKVNKIRIFDSETLSFSIELDKAVVGRKLLELNVKVENAAACEPVTTTTLYTVVNADDVRRASASDDVESDLTAWTRTGQPASDVWSRVETGPGQHAWRGVDLGETSDTQLVSPSLSVSGNQPFTIAFDHRFHFESDGGDFFDGGVIELSQDGGATWTDLLDFADPGYGGAIFGDSGNPLALRPAFVGANAAWPATDHVLVDLGGALAGRTVQLRFRIGTDQAASDFGWEIDNIAVGGITNTPFTALRDDAGLCAKGK